MPVIFKCDCGKYLQVRSKNIGKKVRCPECEKVNVVPDPAAKRTKRLQRLSTKALEASNFDRLKAAVESDEDVALENEEVEGLGLERENGDVPLLDLKPDAGLKAIEDDELDSDSDAEARPARKEKRPEKRSEKRPEKRPEKPARPEKSRSSDREKLRTKDKEKPRDKEKRREKDRKDDERAKRKKKGGPTVACFCGVAHEIGDRKPGDTFKCDACGRMITVPSAASKASLDLAPEEDGERCPHCGVVMEEVSSRCKSCGKKLDLRLLSGRHPKGAAAPEGKEKKKRR